LAILRSVRRSSGQPRGDGAVGWIGFQVHRHPLTCGSLRGWSSLETGFAICPIGAVIVVLSAAIPLLVSGSVCRSGDGRARQLRCRYAAVPADRLHSSYGGRDAPTLLLCGLGAGSGMAPAHILCVTGVVSPEEQGSRACLINVVPFRRRRSCSRSQPLSRAPRLVPGGTRKQRFDASIRDFRPAQVLP